MTTLADETAAPARAASAGFALRHEPAVRFAPGEIEARNAIFRHREPVRLLVEGRSLTIAPAGTAPTQRDALQLAELTWSLGGGEVGCHVDLPALEALFGAVQSDLVDLPDPATAALLLEAILADALDLLDARLGEPLACRDVASGAAAPTPPDAVTFACRLDDLPFSLALWPRAANERGRIAFAEALVRLLGPSLSDGRLDVPPPVVVALEAGHLALAVGALSALRQGDVLIPDTAAGFGEEVDVVIGRGRRARAKLTAEGARLLGTPRRTSSKEPLPVSQPPPKQGAPDPVLPDSLDGIEIDITFELGRSAIELAELKTLAAGHVFALGRDPKASVDILANGRRIGGGEIVRVGDTLGVRITRLAGREG